MTQRLLSVCVSLSIALLFPVCANASGIDLVSINTNPATPGPNEEVTINIQSFAVDLNSATIIWAVDREPMKQGIAERSFTLRMGDFGTTKTVDIAILGANGSKIDKQIVLAPAEIDLLWEAQTYTPPFYKGKALPTFKSMIKVTAIPRYNSYTSNPLEFYYKWTYNRTQGLGEALSKNSVLFPAGWPDSAVPVKIEVELPNTAWKGLEIMNIPVTDALVLFYERAPLLGTRFERTLSGATTTEGNEFSIFAAPYYISNDNIKNDEVVYTWMINRRVVPSNENPLSIRLLKAGKGAESFLVSFRVQNPKRILQEGSAVASVSFPTEQ